MQIRIAIMFGIDAPTNDPKLHCNKVVILKREV